MRTAYATIIAVHYYLYFTSRMQKETTHFVCTHQLVNAYAKATNMRIDFTYLQTSGINLLLLSKILLVYKLNLLAVLKYELQMTYIFIALSAS